MLVFVAHAIHLSPPNCVAFIPHPSAIHPSSPPSASCPHTTWFRHSGLPPPRATLLRSSSSSKRLPSSTLRSKVRVCSAPCSANDVSDTILFWLWLLSVFDFHLGRAVSATDENGATALIQAVRNSHEHVVRALLSASAFPSNLRRKRRALTAVASFPGLTRPSPPSMESSSS